MKKIKLLLTIAISLLLVTAWAEGTNANLTSVKDLAAELLGIYAPEPEPTANDYTAPTLDNSGVSEAKSNYQYLKSFSYKGNVFYGEITSNTSSELNTLYHVVNTEATALEVVAGDNLEIEFDAPSEIWTNKKYGMILTAYCDLDFDKTFESAGDYRKILIGRYSGSYFYQAVGAGHPIVIPIPESTQEGYTRVRIRFDSAWNTLYSTLNNITYQDQNPLKEPIAGSSTAETNRHVYDIIVKVVKETTPVLDVTCDGNMGSVSATITPVGGTATTTETFPVSVSENSSVTVKATPQIGYRFKEWQDGNGNKIDGADATYSFEFGTADVKLTAVFEELNYTIPTMSDNVSWLVGNGQTYITTFKLTGSDSPFYGPISSSTDYPGELSVQYHLIQPTTAINIEQGQTLSIDWAVPTNIKPSHQLFVYCDCDLDKDFWSASGKDFRQLIAGVHNSLSFNTKSGTVEIPIPDDAPVGKTRVRFRFDNYQSSYYDSQSCFVPADAPSDRQVYDIEFNIVEKTEEPVAKYNEPEMSGNGTWLNNTGKMFMESFSHNGVKFYGDITSAEWPDGELKKQYHFIQPTTPITVEQGKTLSIDWKTPDGILKGCQLFVYCDLDLDKNFWSDSEKDYRKLLGGAHGSTPTFGLDPNDKAGTVSIAVPYDAPIGTSRVRFRFDEYNSSEYDSESGFVPADAPSNRHVYDIEFNIVEATTFDLNVLCESSKGYVSATMQGEQDPIETFPKEIAKGTDVVLTATPFPGYFFSKWLDKDGNEVSTESSITITNGNGRLEYTAVFEGYIHEGTYTIRCDAGLHDWRIKYKAMGSNAAIEGLEQPNGAGYCDGFCSVTIPDVMEKAYTIKYIDDTYRDIDITLVQVGTTIIHGQHTIRRLTLPKTIDEIRRTKVLDLTTSKLPLIKADIPSNVEGGTHADTGFANKWEVTPQVTGQEEWWFVGVFDFPTAAQFNGTDGGQFVDYGCALLTSRKWPSQTGVYNSNGVYTKGDDWTNMFQIWVNGTRSHNKHYAALNLLEQSKTDPTVNVEAALEQLRKYPERIAGDIRLVNDKLSAQEDPNFLYFKDKDGNHINVLDNGDVGKIVRFEVHNYPDDGGSGSTMVYSVQTYEKDTYGTDNQTLLQEGSFETHVDNMVPIDWISNYVPTNVSEKMLKFFRPETHMITYRDDVTPTEDFQPTEDCVHGGKKIKLKNNMLVTNEPWMMAIHYIPQVEDEDEIIIATDDNWSSNINQPITDGFRIVQKAKDNKIYFQSSKPTAADDIEFEHIKINPGYPLTIIVYHYPNGMLAVSATDRLNNQIERFEVAPQISSTLSELHTECTYLKHKFDATVATTEHLLFANCPYLEQINVTNNSYYKSIDGAIYDSPGHTLILWPEGKVHPCTDLSFHKDGDPETVINSPYSADASEVVLPPSVRRIAPLAFVNVRDDNVKDLTVHVDNIIEVDRLSYVNAAVTYETTPQHFLEMKKNDQISFRLNLMQGTSNVSEGYLNQIEEKTYSQIALPDRFASATVGNWNTFTVPFDVTADEIATNFSSSKEGGDGVLSPRKLTSADVFYDKNTRRRILRVKFAEQTELEAGVPYIVRVDDVTKSVEQGGHNGEVRFGYHPFKTTLHPVASVEDGGVESIRATEDISMAENGVTVDYTYDVSMLANIDPQNFTGTDSETLNNGGYEYTLMLTNNVFKQVGAGKTAKNKGYRGWLKIVATPTNNGAGQATSNAPIVMDMYMDDNNDATAILEVRPDNEITADGKPVDVYSTSGIRLGNSLDRLPAGVYIINNKKVVKK